MPTTALAGKTGWLKVAGQGLPFQEWSLRLSVTRIDITSFLSLGFSEFIAGFASGLVRAKGIFDPTMPALTIGQSLLLSLGAGGGYSVGFGGILVDVGLSTGVQKAAEIEIEVVTNGVFTPTLAIAA